MGSTIALDLSGLLGNDGGDVGDRGNREYGYSLFPGQIVAVEGINPSGRTMRVTRVIEGVVPPPLASVEEDASPTSSSLSSPVENYHDDRCALSITAVAYVATVVPEQAREVERDRRSHGMPARSLELHRRLVFAYPADAAHPVLPRQAHGRPLGVSSAYNDVAHPVPTVVVRRPLLPPHLVLDDPVHLGGDLLVLDLVP
jgi:hypothetical protein